MKLNKLAEGTCGGSREEEESRGTFKSGDGKYIVIGGDPKDEETFRTLEKVAYSVAEQLRDPELGLHTQAGVGQEGWFVRVVVNK